MKKSMTQTTFIERANVVHQEKYRYDRVQFNTLKDKVIIECKVHGFFEQRAGDHIHKGVGCAKCGNRFPVSDDTFLKKASTVHGDKYNYSLVFGIKNIDTRVSVMCRHHGIFQTSYREHVTAGVGCVGCARVSQQLRGIARRGTKESFIEKAKKIHGDKYNYNLVEYVTCKEKVTIGCPVHGSFEQTPNMHISNKQGCPECYEDRRHLGNRGFNMDFSIETATLYVIRFVSDKESFIKVGITTRGVTQRWGKKKHQDYQIELIVQRNLSLRTAFEIEQQSIQLLSDYRSYDPNRLLAGNTECFIDVPYVTDKLLSIVER